MLDYTREQQHLLFFFLLLHENRLYRGFLLKFWHKISQLNYLKATRLKKKKKKGFLPRFILAPLYSSVCGKTHGLARTHSYTHTNTVNHDRSVHRLRSPSLSLQRTQGQRSLRPPQLSSNPADDSMAYSSLFLIRCWSQNSGSLSRFMQVLAVGRRSRSLPPLWMQKTG